MEKDEILCIFHKSERAFLEKKMQKFYFLYKKLRKKENFSYENHLKNRSFFEKMKKYLRF